MPEFNYLTTHVGSVSHTDAHNLSTRLLSMLDIPCWLQLPRRDFRENIYTQYAPTLPGAVVIEETPRSIWSTSILFTPMIYPLSTDSWKSVISIIRELPPNEAAIPDGIVADFSNIPAGSHIPTS